MNPFRLTAVHQQPATVHGLAAALLAAGLLMDPAATSAEQPADREQMLIEVDQWALEIPMDAFVAELRAERVVVREGGAVRVRSIRQQPAPESAPARPTGPALTFTDGQVLEGKLAGMNGDLIRWSSPLFDDIAELDQRAIASIHLTEAVDEMSFEDPLVVALADGGRIYGELVSISDREIIIDSSRVGTVTLHRDAVGSLQWLRQGDLLWSGPHGTTGWSYIRPPQQGSAWRALPDGSMRTLGWHQDTQLKLDEFPAMMEVEFTVEAEEALRFELNLEIGGETGAIATWGDELVLLRGEEFISLGSYDPAAPLTLRWFWDRRRERGLVTDASGNPLGQWRADAERAGQVEEGADGSLIFLAPRHAPGARPDSAPADPAADEDPFLLPEFALVSGMFTLKNRGPSLTLTTFKVRQWSGEDPQPRTAAQADGARVLLAGDQVVALGEATSLAVTDGRVRIRQGNGADPLELDLAKVEGIWFPGDQGDAARSAGPVTLKFADGSRWHGELQAIGDERLTVRTAYSEQAFATGTSDVVELLFDPEHGDGPGAVASVGRDLLSFESQTLTGTWQPDTGDRLRWLLPGAASAVAVSSANRHEITRPLEADARRLQTALLHLADGQVIPGEIESIAANGGSVALRSPLLDDLTVDARLIRAVQFPGEQLLVDGFNDGGWRISLGAQDENVVFDEGDSGREVTLKPGGAFAHPGILLTNQLSFNATISPRGALRIRMFEGPGERDSMAIVLAQTSNQLHCGIETGQQSFSSQGSLTLPEGVPLAVAISWDDEQVIVRVNDELVATIAHQHRDAMGRYLGLEVSELWRSTTTQIRVSDFSLNPEHGMSSVPVVNRQAREQALTLPRFLREPPPRHVLLAHNGDLLRGTIEGGGGDSLNFRTGNRSYQIPVGRAAAAIWLTMPEGENPDVTTGDAAEQVTGSGETYTLLLHSGGTLMMQVESFGPEVVEGTVAGIGSGRIPVDMVAEIQSGDRQLADRPSLFAGWRLQRTPDPLPIASGQDGRTNPLVGENAPTLELPLLAAADEEEPVMFNLAEYRGKVVVLDFWATWCAVCVRSLPEKMDAFAGFDPEKVVFLAVNQAEGPDLVRWFLESRGWTDLKVAMDRDQSVGRSYQVGGLPHSVIIGPDGRIAWVSTGFRTGGSRTLVEVVESLLDSTAPDA